MTSTPWQLCCLAAATLVLGGCPLADATTPECENDLVTLFSGEPVWTNASPGCDATFVIDVPAGQGQLMVTALGGEGASELLVRHLVPPTYGEYRCRADDGDADLCEIGDGSPAGNLNQRPAEGEWYITVTGNVREILVTATIYEVPPTISITRLTSGVTYGGVSGARNSYKYFEVVVPVGSTWLEVQTSGGVGDVEMFVGRGLRPDQADVECSSTNYGNADRCEITNPIADLWYITLYGFLDYSGVSIKATAGSGAPPPPPQSSPFSGSWRRYGNPNGYQDDLKIGGIPGQPDNRVYLCTLPPTPNPALYKGSLLADGKTIRWDAAHGGIPDYTMQSTGTNTMQFVVNGNVGGRYERANWRPGSCGLTL